MFHALSGATQISPKTDAATKIGLYLLCSSFLPPSFSPAVKTDAKLSEVSCTALDLSEEKAQLEEILAQTTEDADR